MTAAVSDFVALASWEDRQALTEGGVWSGRERGGERGRTRETGEGEEGKREREMEKERKEEEEKGEERRKKGIEIEREMRDGKKDRYIVREREADQRREKIDKQTN